MQTLLEAARGNRLTLRPDDASWEVIQKGCPVRLGLSPLHVRVPDGRSDAVYIRPARGSLRVPGTWRLHAREEEGELLLGPVIGIFTSSVRRSAHRPFASLTERFRRLIAAAREMGAIAYVFTPKGIRWESRVIRGYTYLPRGRGAKWVRGVFPFPNVVYNRVPTRRAETRLSVKKARLRLLNEPDLTLFNPEFLDKWRVYEILRSDEALRPHLPETSVCDGISQLLPFLQEHRRVYLKMADGSLGRGTVRVELAKDGSYRWRATRPGGHMVNRILRKPANLKASLNRLRRGRRYLMQQAVTLLKAGERPFDVRALVQKDASGRWQVTGMAARIAGKGQITTHRPRGGSRARLVPLIRSIFGDEAAARRITHELQRVILRAADIFDKATGNCHGELSMDVGLDSRGHPWIFELNSKPAVFDEPSIRRVARKRLLHYCFTRGGFPLKTSGDAV